MSGRTEDQAREQEVAGLVAAARAEALRRARQRYGPGPLYRRMSSGWQQIPEDEGEAS